MSLNPGWTPFKIEKLTRFCRKADTGIPKSAETPKTFASRHLHSSSKNFAHFSNDQRFVYYEHVLAGVMQFDDSRVLHA